MDEELFSDDLVPNDSSYFAPEPDPEIARAVNVEKAMVQAARPLFDHITAWFDKQIGECDSIDNISHPVQSVGELTVAEQVMAMKEVKRRLVVAKSSLEVLRDTYL